MPRPPETGRPVAITGMAVTTAAGRGTAPLAERIFAGRPAFGPVSRFDTARYRVGVDAHLPDAGSLSDELALVVADACAAARLTGADRAACPLWLAAHRDPEFARLTAAERAAALAGGGPAGALAGRTGLGGPVRTYVTACVSASTAVADAAAMISSGRADRAVIAAGYLVSEDDFALFDSGRALAADGRVRPFSTGRRGLLLGDGVAAVVLEAESAATRREIPALATLAGWGRAGDAYHPCRPRPAGTGTGRAVFAALRRAGLAPEEVGYVNAHGTATPANDPAEAAGLRLALGEHAGQVPVSSTKSVHGHTLEAAGLVELVATVLALREGRLPVNAGFLGADPKCPLNLVLDAPREQRPRYALSVNVAFGGANTALLVERSAA
jgi:3-oxoacyl-[acyl-carrier-protein] synthase II